MIKAVIISIPVLFIGGTEIQTLNLVRVLVGASYQVTVCCYYEYDQHMVKRFENAGATVVLMKYERAKGLWYLAKGLARIFRKKKPDIVHVQYMAPGLVPIIAAKLAGIKNIFATVHQPGSPYGVKAKLLIHAADRLCTAFFCNSLAVEKSWFGDSKILDPDDIKGKRKHFTIYNAVDVDSIEKAGIVANRKSLRLTMGISGKKVIGVVGRLRWEKGQSLLIDAMPEVIKQFPDVVLLIVGDGQDRERLRLKADSLKLAKHIIWLGQKSSKEVNQLYSIMDIVAVPSVFEGFGLVAAEAMAAGVPVVGANVGGLAEVIEDSVTGILVPASDSRALANALLKLLSDKDRAEEMGQKGQERDRELFSMKRFQQSILAAYKAFSS